MFRVKTDDTKIFDAVCFLAEHLLVAVEHVLSPLSVAVAYTADVYRVIDGVVSPYLA